MISDPLNGPADNARLDRLAYSEDGVDLTLIRWMLSLTPAERLKVLQQYVDSVLMIRAWNFEALIAVKEETARDKDRASVTHFAPEPRRIPQKVNHR